LCRNFEKKVLKRKTHPVVDDVFPKIAFEKPFSKETLQEPQQGYSLIGEISLRGDLWPNLPPRREGII
jgi:hypothetical protein